MASLSDCGQNYRPLWTARVEMSSEDKGDQLKGKARSIRDGARTRSDWAWWLLEDRILVFDRNEHCGGLFMNHESGSEQGSKPCALGYLPNFRHLI